MDKVDHRTAQELLRKKSHMPQHSIFFEKVVPILLVVMGVVTAALILFAAGVLLGVVQY